MNCKHSFRYSQGHLFCIYCGKKTSAKHYKRKNYAKSTIVICTILVVCLLAYLSVEGKTIVIEQTNSATEIMKNSETIINNIKIITENVTDDISKESNDDSKT